PEKKVMSVIPGNPLVPCKTTGNGSALMCVCFPLEEVTCTTPSRSIGLVSEVKLTRIVRGTTTLASILAKVAGSTRTYGARAGTTLNATFVSCEAEPNSTWKDRVVPIGTSCTT